MKIPFVLSILLVPLACQCGASRPAIPLLEGARMDSVECVNIKLEDLRPRLIDRDMPPMPSEARADGTGGVVVVKILFAPDGHVTGLKFLKGEEPFRSTVRDAVKNWRREPHVEAGKPVSTCTVHKFEFMMGG